MNNAICVHTTCATFCCPSLTANASSGFSDTPIDAELSEWLCKSIVSISALPLFTHSVNIASNPGNSILQPHRELRRTLMVKFAHGLSLLVLHPRHDHIPQQPLSPPQPVLGQEIESGTTYEARSGKVCINRVCRINERTKAENNFSRMMTD